MGECGEELGGRPRTSTSFESMNFRHCECNRDLKLSEMRCLRYRVSPVVYAPSCNFRLFITFEALISGAASVAECAKVYYASKQ